MEAISQIMVAVSGPMASGVQVLASHMGTCMLLAVLVLSSLDCCRAENNAKPSTGAGLPSHLWHGWAANHCARCAARQYYSAVVCINQRITQHTDMSVYIFAIPAARGLASTEHFAEC